jgi:hypothetical protein
MSSDADTPTEPELTREMIESLLDGFLSRVQYPSCITTMEQAKAFFKEIHNAEPDADAFVACCDACGEEVKGIVPFEQNTHKCEACGIGFDLCGECVAAGEVRRDKCPKSRGCGEDGVRTKLDYSRRVMAEMFDFIVEKAKPRVIHLEDFLDVLTTKLIAPTA